MWRKHYQGGDVYSQISSENLFGDFHKKHFLIDISRRASKKTLAEKTLAEWTLSRKTHFQRNSREDTSKEYTSLEKTRP